VELKKIHTLLRLSHTPVCFFAKKERRDAQGRFPSAFGNLIRTKYQKPASQQLSCQDAGFCLRYRWFGVVFGALDSSVESEGKIGAKDDVW
jgi:hypothetical protein